MEVLITSAKPISMMFGKVIASCIAGFSQLFLSAKIYRVGVLLYGTPPKISTIIKTVFKKQ